jgi:hypothetical protein
MGGIRAMASLPQQPVPFAGEPALIASAWEKDNARLLRWLAVALVIVGLAWRFARYLLRFPIWGDEAMLLVNYFSKSYLDLLGPIDNCQVAPLLFHWVELTAVRWLGTSELAVRLPAFLACLGSLVLFWRLAHLTLPPLARTLAVGILCVSIWPATMGSLTKPYASDLFFSLLLLVLAVTWLRKPDRLWSLVALVVVVPVCVLASYPSVFIAGAVGIALFPAVWRDYHGQQQQRKVVLLFALFNLLLVGTFAAHYLLVGLSHLRSPMPGHSTTAQGMASYWEMGFPPLALVPFIKWFLLAHTGQIAAYPLGSANGGSSLTVLVGLIGLWYLYRQGQRGLLTLVAAAFVLWFIAGALHRYPYGASCRVSQHAAPFYCLLAGLGLSVWIHRLQTSRGRWKATLTVGIVLGLIGIGGVIRDFRRPWRDDDALWARQQTASLMARAGNDPILVLQDFERIDAPLQWQLGIHRAQVVQRPDINWQKLGHSQSSLWIFSYGEAGREEEDQLRLLLEQSNQPWHCIYRNRSLLPQWRPDQGFLHCRMYHYER